MDSPGSSSERQCRDLVWILPYDTDTRERGARRILTSANQNRLLGSDGGLGLKTASQMALT